MIIKKKRRVVARKKRTLDPCTIIDFKKPDILKRFVTDRGKIIPRRISGATSAQQRLLSTAIKRARYLALLPYTVAHRHERGFAGEMTVAVATPHYTPRYRQDEGSYHKESDQPERKEFKDE